MESIEELKQALKDGKNVVWNDPDPIKGANYRINSAITCEDDSHSDGDTIVSIMYNNFCSEAEVCLHELSIKE